MSTSGITILNVLAFLFGSVISIGGLALALRELPVGTSYAVWVGVGAFTTVLWAVLSGAEVLSIAKVVFILMIVAGVAGLKIVT